MALSKLDIYNPSCHIFELDYLSDSIFRANFSGNSSRRFTIRIFGGGESNIQTIQLKAAIIEELNKEACCISCRSAAFTLQVITLI